MNKLYETARIFVTFFDRELAKGEDYNRWLVDPEIAKFNTHGLFPYTESEKEAFLSSIEKHEKIVWAVFLKNNDNGSYNPKHVGNISLDRLNFIYHSAEMGFMFDKEVWGKGIATEAGKLLVDFGFKRLALHRIWLCTAEINIGMQKVAEKIGFQKTGVFREAMYLCGQYMSAYHYDILRSEW